MREINGKVLVFTDLHLGLKGNSVKRLNICVKAIKQIIDYIKSNAIKHVVFCGDWHHHRISTENNVLNVSYKLMSALAKCAEMHLIVGNHDSFMKNSIDVNSLVCFKSIPNVNLIAETAEVSINGNRSLFVPWLGDISQYAAESIDMMFGHFDVSSKYLIRSYIQDHQNNVSVSDSLNKKIDADSAFTTVENVADYIGDFVDVVKKHTGTIFAGHIHQHRECISKGRNFVFIGDPYQQNLGERTYDCGFYVINEDNSYEFHEISNVPKHIEIRMSAVMKDIDNYDFKNVTNNIIHKIYDIDVDPLIDAKISQRINDLHPYEELLPDYEVDMNNADVKIQNETISLIKKSKLEYIKNYVDNIDKSTLNDQQLDAEKLFGTLREYYNKVTEDK